MRLLFSCAELGLGHASRVISLGKKLEKNGNKLFFFSGGTAYQLLKKEFRNVYPCTPVGWYENAHGIVTSASLINILFPLPFFNYEKNTLEIKNSNAMETMHRYYDLRRRILKIKPDLIVSDGDMNILRLAHRWRFPSVYITNLIRPGCGFPSVLSPGERFTERYVKHSSKIIIPDNPPPYTICEYNIGDLDAIGISEKVKFVGGFLDTTPVKGLEEHIFAPISGPFGTRAKLMQMIIPVLKDLETRSIVSLGLPGEKKTAKIGNCEIHTWLYPQERQECMKNSKLIVFSGGHITCFETIKYAKPSICIPTQPEQLGNGAKLQKLNCSIVVKNKKQLRLAVQEIEEKKQFFKTNAERLSRFSNNFKGLDAAVEIIGNMVK
jgi:UDP-N-acetylglucosamine--N-acetylmuramyl-(pentapeptide) pyrophosphoryl-undecaprenol N-acetylglucosamine transferase